MNRNQSQNLNVPSRDSDQQGELIPRHASSWGPGPKSSSSWEGAQGAQHYTSQPDLTTQNIVSSKRAQECLTHTASESSVGVKANSKAIYDDQQAERENYRHKLEKHGILDFLTKGLVRLELSLNGNRPVSNPESYLKEQMTSVEFNPLQLEADILHNEYNEAYYENIKLQGEVALLKMQVEELSRLHHEREENIDQKNPRDDNWDKQRSVW